jgi:hypothetical protein
VRSWFDGTEYRACAGRWKATWNDRHAEVPDCLYHYTKPEGLKGILTSQSIWATNARYLNDLSELVYINDVVRNVVRELREEFTGGLPRDFLDAVARDLLDAFTGPYRVYVACFCECGDRLSQWQAYAPSGYALGFSPEPMRINTRLLLRKVSYKTKDQESMVRSALRSIADCLANMPPEPAVVERALIEAGDLLTEAAFCFKHAAFEGEQEWRLVHRVLADPYLEDAPPRFRTATTGSRVPYVELRPDGEQPGIETPLPIMKLVVGPNRDMEAAEAIGRELLASARFGADVEVIGSKIPLRV